MRLPLLPRSLPSVEWHTRQVSQITRFRHPARADHRAGLRKHLPAMLQAGLDVGWRVEPGL
jgi:hypothetical protein